MTAYWRRALRRPAARRRGASATASTTRTLPPEVVEAVAANLAILKSPTVLRQADGRLWAWEGCGDDARLLRTARARTSGTTPRPSRTCFPAWSGRSARRSSARRRTTRGHQTFRSALPIRPRAARFPRRRRRPAGRHHEGLPRVAHQRRHAAGSRASGRKVKASLDYCIATWDPGRKGVARGAAPQHLRHRVLGPRRHVHQLLSRRALQAAAVMGEALGEDVARVPRPVRQGRAPAWKRSCSTASTSSRRSSGRACGPRARWSARAWPATTRPRPRRCSAEGGAQVPVRHAAACPTACWALAGLVCGWARCWTAARSPATCGPFTSTISGHDLSDHANPQRPSYACGAEGGLLLCTWPKGGEPTLPFVYSDEVWTGIEYQVAVAPDAHGPGRRGPGIVRACRDRYDGRVRNPFNEYECGHWYARAMSSYALLQGLSGARYDAVEKVLYLEPSLPGDFRCLPLHRHRLRHRGRPRRQAVSGGQGGDDRYPPDQASGVCGGLETGNVCAPGGRRPLSAADGQYTT